MVQASLIEEVRRSIAASAPFRVTFTQKMISKGQTEMEEKGFFLYQSPERMKWVYQSPEEKIFIVRGGQLSFYEPLEKQLTVGDIKDQKNQWLWQILLRDMPEILTEENPTNRSITFRHREDDTAFTVHFGEDRLPLRVVQADALGYEYHYFFSGYEVRCYLEKGAFELELPQDVEIIEME
jgi:outer membrane lipoprotein-sorting protein